MATLLASPIPFPGQRVSMHLHDPETDRPRMGSTRYRSRPGLPKSGIERFRWRDGLPMAVAGVGAELRAVCPRVQVAEGTDTLIVPGTGLVTDAFGLSTGARTASSSGSCGKAPAAARVLFVSVGAGPFDGVRRQGSGQGGLVAGRLPVLPGRSEPGVPERIGFPAQEPTRSTQTSSSACRRRCSPRPRATPGRGASSASG